MSALYSKIRTRVSSLNEYVSDKKKELNLVPHRCESYIAQCSISKTSYHKANPSSWGEYARKLL